MNTDDLIRLIAPIAFKGADKFFKFISWMIIIVAIRYARIKTDVAELFYLEFLTMQVWGLALFLQIFYLGMRDPSTLGVPSQYARFSRVLQMIGGLILILILASPYLFMDNIINALVAIR